MHTVPKRFFSQTNDVKEVTAKGWLHFQGHKHLQNYPEPDPFCLIISENPFISGGLNRKLVRTISLCTSLKQSRHIQRYFPHYLNNPGLHKHVKLQSPPSKTLKNSNISTCFPLWELNCLQSRHKYSSEWLLPSFTKGTSECKTDFIMLVLLDRSSLQILDKNSSPLTEVMQHWNTLEHNTDIF